jgi:plasmid stabilization system protein ParE
LKHQKVVVSPTAQAQYKKICAYLIEKWSINASENFEKLTDQKIFQVSEFPKSCPESKSKKGVFKAVIEQHNSFYYRINQSVIEILIFVDNRIDPKAKAKQLKKTKH